MCRNCPKKKKSGDGGKTSAELTRRESTKKGENIIEKEEGYRENLKDKTYLKRKVRKKYQLLAQGRVK
jgi:hypothetical protein